MIGENRYNCLSKWGSKAGNPNIKVMDMLASVDGSEYNKCLSEARKNRTQGISQDEGFEIGD